MYCLIFKLQELNPNKKNRNVVSMGKIFQYKVEM